MLRVDWFMNGLIEGGVNDCYHNMNGFCVALTCIGIGSGQMVERVRCVATQFEVVKCGYCRW